MLKKSDCDKAMHTTIFDMNDELFAKHIEESGYQIDLPTFSDDEKWVQEYKEQFGTEPTFF